MVKVKKKKREKSRIYLSILIIVVSIIMIYYAYTHSMSNTVTPSQTQDHYYIPIYLDTSIYTKVRKDDVTSLVLKAIKSEEIKSINLITFGSTTCPHCRNLHEFFEKNFKNRYAFLWVDDPNNAELFRRLAQIEQNGGLPLSYAYSVPQTVVVRYGEPIAIVIGEITDTDFWQKLIAS